MVLPTSRVGLTPCHSSLETCSQTKVCVYLIFQIFLNPVKLIANVNYYSLHTEGDIVGGRHIGKDMNYIAGVGVVGRMGDM
jgi:hypothetical protein